jgi:replicative DNA helicase
MANFGAVTASRRLWLFCFCQKGGSCMSSTSDLLYSLLARHGQPYSMARGTEYLPQRQGDGSYVPLTTAMLQNHVAGTITLAIQPINPQDGNVMFAVLDIDSDGGRDALWRSYQQAKAVQQSTQDPLYIEFSGRRGWHVWAFFASPTSAQEARDYMTALGKKVGLPHFEVFPAGITLSNTYYPTPVKVPCGVHPGSGKRSGFLMEWDGAGNIPTEFPDQATFLAGVQRISPNTLSTSMPPCIEYLTKYGVPASLEYNKANMTIARYSIVAGLGEGEALLLAGQMAEHTASHPTSKASKDDKLANFRSVWAAMVKHPQEWACGYLLGNNDIRQAACGTCARSGRGEGVSTAAADAEREVVTYLLAHPEVALPPLQPIDFISEQVQGRSVPGEIMRVMRELGASRSLGTLLNGLPGTLAPYAAAYLDTPPVITASAYDVDVQVLQDNAARRTLDRELRKWQNQAAVQPPLHIAAQLIDLAEGILRTRATSVRSMADDMTALVETLSHKAAPTVPTFDPRLNVMFGRGLRSDRLYVIGGGPGAGKTTFAMQVADYAAAQGHSVFVASLEISKQQLLTTALARVSRINSMIIEDPNQWLDTPQEDVITAAVDQYWTNIAPRLYIHTPASMTVDELRAALKHVPDDPLKPRVVIIDYIQLLRSGVPTLDDNPGARRDLLDYVGKAVKQLATTEHCAVIALGAITKEAFKTMKNGTIPGMEGTEGAFALSHHADTFGFLVSGDMIAELVPDVGEQGTSVVPAVLSIQKNRGGPLGDATYRYEKALHTFKPLDAEITHLKKTES